MHFDYAQRRQKGFAPILIVLLIVVLGIGGYFVYTSLRGGGEAGDVAISPSPTPQLSPSPTDETANWKILNNKNGFSVQYPNSLKTLGAGIQVDETNAPDVIIATKPGDPQDNSPALHINISPKASTIYKDMTLAQISQENYDANQANKNTFKQVVTPLKPTTLDGKTAYTYTILASSFSGKWNGWPVNASVNNVEKLTIIESENNGNYFIIVYSANDSTITKVLSTFKFIQ